MNAQVQLIRVIEAMNDRPIAFNPVYVKIGCGINGALMLSQLVYWSSRTKNKDGWIFKTHEDWTDETGLTRREQDTARKTLKSLGFLSEKKQGVPCRVFFKVNHENLYKSLQEYAESLEPSQLHNSAKLDAQISQTSCTDAPNKNGGMRQTSMAECAQLVAQIRPSKTEITTENTTESVSASAPQKTPKSKSEKFSVKKYLLDLNVSEQTAIEYIQLRDKKRKPITETVIKLVAKQASEAQISIDLALRIICAKGWDSFKATWQWQDVANDLINLDKPVEKKPQPQARVITRDQLEDL